MNNTMQALSILQISDTHLLAESEDKMLGIATEKYFVRVLEQAFAEQRHYDLVLVTGDLTQTPTVQSYQRIANYLAQSGIPVRCLPGNHDNLSLMQQILNTATLSCRPHAVFEQWQVILLNSQIVGDAGGRLLPQELKFLENCLQQYPEHFAMVATHHHCVPTQSEWMDTMMIENSHEFLELVQRYPQVKVITTGHIHQELDVQTSGFRILGNPSTFFQFTPFSPDFSLDETAPGYRQFLLYPDGSLSTEVKRLPGALTELQWDENGYFEGP